MAIEDFAAEPATAATVRTQVRFSRPLRYVVRAVLFLALIGFLGYRHAVSRLGKLLMK